VAFTLLHPALKERGELFETLTREPWRRRVYRVLRKARQKKHHRQASFAGPKRLAERDDRPVRARLQRLSRVSTELTEKGVGRG